MGALKVNQVWRMKEERLFASETREGRDKNLAGSLRWISPCVFFQRNRRIVAAATSQSRSIHEPRALPWNRLRHTLITDANGIIAGIAVS